MDAQGTANLYSDIGLYGQIGALALNTVGAFLSARGSKANAKAQAEIARINARRSQMQAWAALEQGQHEAFARTLKYGQMAGRQRALQAASGVRLSSGSAAEVRAGEEVMKDVDVGTIERNALMQAWGYRAAAADYTGQAEATLAAAKGINPWGTAAGTLLSGSGQVAAYWYQYQKNQPVNQNTSGMLSDTGMGTDGYRAFWQKTTPDSFSGLYTNPFGLPNDDRHAFLFGGR